jgi:hypothetical protein
MADDGTRKLGPGVLKIGATGAEIDVSCLINNAAIAATKDQGDSTTKLCGTVKPGATSYTYALSGNIDTDVALESGFFALSQTAPGTEQEFTYTPNNEFTAPATDGTTATGILVIDPLDFGGDTMGETMTSDFEFAIVGAPEYVFSVVGALAARDDEAMAS